MSEMDKALEELQKSLSGSEFYKAEKSEDEPTDEDFEKKMKKFAKEQPDLFKKMAKGDEPDGDEDEAFAKKMKKYLKHAEPDGDEGEPDGDEDKAFAKKMKKFMADNKDFAKKFAKFDESADLKKAMENVFNETLDNPDFEQATAVMVEGTEFFKATRDYMNSTNKMLQNLVGVVSDLSDRMERNEKISVNSGIVLAKAFSGIKENSNTPNPVKGAQRIAISDTPSNGNDILSKAQNLDFKKVTDALFKAATDEKNPSHRAATALSQYEMAKGDVRRIPVESMKFISELNLG